MNIPIDILSDPTGWTASGGASIEPVNEHKHLIAGNNSASLVFKFTDIGQSVEKIFATPIDITGFPQLVMHAWSRFHKLSNYEKPSDFYYDIELGDSVKHLLPIRPTWEYLEVDLGTLTSVTKLKITSRKVGEDYLIVSNCVACIDELPLDLFKGVKEQIEFEIDSVLGSGVLIGVCDSQEGDKKISLPETKFIEKHSVIKIKKGAIEELHQVWDYDGSKWNFTSLYDGQSFLNSFDQADVYIHFPVEYGQNEKEILSPSIVIWGLVAEPFERGNKLDEQLDSWKENGVRTRRDGQPLRWTIQIDINSRSSELATVLSHYVRRVLSKNIIWVNGKKVQVNFDGAPTDEVPSQFYGQEIKLTYQASIEIIEDVYLRSVAVLSNAATSSIQINAKNGLIIH
jgi:hypothetical protein